MFHGITSPTAEVVNKAQETLKPKSSSDLIKMLEERNRLINTARKEAGKDWKLDDVKAFGGTNDEKAAKWNTAYAERAAIMNILRERDKDDLQESESNAAEDMIRNHRRRNNETSVNTNILNSQHEDRIPETRRLHTSLNQFVTNVLGESYNMAEFHSAFSKRSFTLPVNMARLTSEPFVNVITSADVIKQGTGGTEAQAGVGILRFPPLRDDFEMASRRPVNIYDWLRSSAISIPVGGGLAYRYAAETDPTGTAPAVKDEAAALSKRKYGSEIRTADMVKIGAYAPYSIEEALSVGMFGNRINEIINIDTIQEVESALITSNAANFKGLLNLDNIQSTAQGGTSANPVYGVDALHLGITKVFSVGNAFANFFLMHPTDWHETVTQRDTQNRLLVGSQEVAFTQTIFGLPVMQSVATTQGVVLTGDSNRVKMLMMDGVMVETSNSHNDGFIQAVDTIRAIAFVGLMNRRGTAFHKTTGYMGLDDS